MVESTFSPGEPLQNAAPHKKSYRLLIAVLTCPKNQARAQAVRDTWLSRPLPPDVLAFFVMGRPGQPPGFEGDTLYLDCPEAYERLPVKTWTLLEYCLANFEFEHILKCDDDNYISMPEMLSYPAHGKDYIGRFYGRLTRNWHFGKCDDPALEVKYRGATPECKWAAGAGYFVSRRAASIVIDRVTLANAYEELYEDVMVGVALRPTKASKKSSEIKVDKLKIGYWQHVRHPVNPEKMRHIHSRRSFWRGLRSRLLNSTRIAH